MTKGELRKESKARKKLLTGAQKEQAELAVLATLESRKEFINARKILAYYSLPDELPTIRLLQKWSDKKEIYLPRVVGNALEIAPFTPGKTEEGAYSIQEPTASETTDIADIDLIIVPAVGYDRCGNRLGRGKGYYDRLLGYARCPKIGIIYDCQLFEKVPAEPHDIPVDCIITEKEIINP